VRVCQAFTAPAAAAVAADDAPATDHNYVTSAGKCKQITQMYLTHTPSGPTPTHAHRPTPTARWFAGCMLNCSWNGNSVRPLKPRTLRAVELDYRGKNKGVEIEKTKKLKTYNIF